MPDDHALPDLSAGQLERLIELDELLRSQGDPGRVSSDLAGAKRVLKALHAQRLAADPTLPPPPKNIPLRIGRYEILGLLGVGGFAVVYRARDPLLKRDVAIKIPLPYRLVNPDARRRFLREAQTAAKLDHPHIVPAYETGEDGPMPYIAYAYCSGPTLAHWLQQSGPFTPQDAARLVMNLADAVGYSHEQGVLHRDIKPSNVLLFPRPRAPADATFPYIPRLTDFGLAKLAEAVHQDTRSSMILGTPLYMAPEQIEMDTGEFVQETDVYGLGGILYETISGQPPVQEGTLLQVMQTIREGRFPRLSDVRPDVPDELSVICAKALSTNPADRYHTAIQLRDDLQRYLDGRPITARMPGIRKRMLRIITAPARIGQTGGYVIFANLIIALWSAGWLITIALGAPIVEGTDINDIFLETCGLICAHLVCAGIGWAIIQGHAWAAIVSALIALLFVCRTLVILLRISHEPLQSLFPNERARDVVLSMVMVIFGMQTLLCLSAWLAIRKQKHLAQRRRRPAEPVR
jgi:hypothetical protein